jgi:hypothetical protein
LVPGDRIESVTVIELLVIEPKICTKVAGVEGELPLHERREFARMLTLPWAISH